MAKKTAEVEEKKCAITRETFVKGAKAVQASINGVPMLIPTKEFSTGSFGWYMNGRTVIEVDGVAVPVQVGVILTVQHSNKK